jgi:ribose 5-phosphate isomerase RpiB
MHIGLIVEESQAFRMPVIESTLRRVADKYDHTMVNYTNDKATCAKLSLLSGVLINSGVADFIVTGCGTGGGAMMTMNALPRVQCVFVAEPVDARMFRELNMGNAVSMAFSKRYGNEGDLNLEYTLDELFCPQKLPYYMGKKTHEDCLCYKEEWDMLKEKASRPIIDILQDLDDTYVKEALDSEAFRENFFGACRNPALEALVRQKMGL